MDTVRLRRGKISTVEGGRGGGGASRPTRASMTPAFMVIIQSFLRTPLSPARTSSFSARARAKCGPGSQSNFRFVSFRQLFILRPFELQLSRQTQEGRRRKSNHHSIPRSPQPERLRRFKRSTYSSTRYSFCALSLKKVNCLTT